MFDTVCTCHSAHKLPVYQSNANPAIENDIISAFLSAEFESLHSHMHFNFLASFCYISYRNFFNLVQQEQSTFTLQCGRVP